MPGEPGPSGGSETGSPGGSTRPDSVTACIQVGWPAPYQWKSKLEHGRSRIDAAAWMGSLIEGWRDLTGQLYMRNPFYDPQSGKFTQEDPIGIAGGLNVYGFGGGDPVNYSDPYGLCPDKLRLSTGMCPGGLNDKEWDQSSKSTQDMSQYEGARIRTALKEGRVWGYSGGDYSPFFGHTTDNVITVNRRKDATRTRFTGNVFGSPEQLAKTLIHEDRHVQQFHDKGIAVDKANALYNKATDPLTHQNLYEIDAYRFQRENYIPRHR